MLVNRKFLFVFAAAFVSPASWGQQQPLQSDPTQQPYPLLNPVHQTSHGRVIPTHTEYAGPNAGRAVPDACVFHVHLEADEKAIEARQVGAARKNSETDCEADFVVGVPTQIAPPSSGATRLVTPNSATSGPGSGIPPPPGLDRSTVTSPRGQVPFLREGSPNPAIQEPGGRRPILRKKGGDVIRLPRGVSQAVVPQAKVKPHIVCSPPIWCYAPYQFLAGGQGYSATFDPVNITVTSVTSNVDYYASYYWPGGCVFPGSGHDSTYAFGYTSWYLYSDNSADYDTCEDDGAGGFIQENYTAIVDYVIFSNPLFCFGITTWSEYYPQEVDGNSDQTLDGWYAYILGGSPCAGWLSPQLMQLTRLY